MIQGEAERRVPQATLSPTCVHGGLSLPHLQLECVEGQEAQGHARHERCMQQQQM